MRAGALRHQITIQTPAWSSVDGYGEVNGIYSAGIEYWASVNPLSEVERERALGVVGVVTHRIEMRSQGGGECESDYQILFGSRTFQVVSVINPEELGARLEILAKELS